MTQNHISCLGSRIIRELFIYVLLTHIQNFVHVFNRERVTLRPRYR